MTWFQCAIVFSCLWWMVLFCALPIGMASASEKEGGRKAPSLRKKCLWVTVIALLLALASKGVMDSGLIPAVKDW